jgi:hypothetical protein
LADPLALAYLEGGFEDGDRVDVEIGEQDQVTFRTGAPS